MKRRPSPSIHETQTAPDLMIDEGTANRFYDEALDYIEGPMTSESFSFEATQKLIVNLKRALAFYKTIDDVGGTPEMLGVLLSAQIEYLHKAASDESSTIDTLNADARYYFAEQIQLTKDQSLQCKIYDKILHLDELIIESWLDNKARFSAFEIGQAITRYLHTLHNITRQGGHLTRERHDTINQVILELTQKIIKSEDERAPLSLNALGALLKPNVARIQHALCCFTQRAVDRTHHARLRALTRLSQPAAKLTIGFNQFGLTCGPSDAPENPGRFGEHVTRVLEQAATQGVKITEHTKQIDAAFLAALHPTNRYLVHLSRAMLLSDMLGIYVTIDPPGETPIRRDTIIAGVQAVDLAVSQTHRLLRGTIEHAIALTRPPGHHSEHGGFCLFNTAAAAVITALNNGKRVVLFDCDVHHGDGTLDVLLRYLTANPAKASQLVFINFYSTGIYKGTGLEGEWPLHALPKIPAPLQTSFFNVGLEKGSADGDLLKTLKLIVKTVQARMQGAHVIVSLGVDGLANDPLAGPDAPTSASNRLGWKLTPDVYSQTLKLLCKRLEARTSHIILEGGYSDENIGAVLQRVIAAQLQLRVAPKPSPRDVREASRSADMWSEASSPSIRSPAERSTSVTSAAEPAASPTLLAGLMRTAK